MCSYLFPSVVSEVYIHGKKQDGKTNRGVVNAVWLNLDRGSQGGWVYEISPKVGGHLHHSYLLLHLHRRWTFFMSFWNPYGRYFAALRTSFLLLTIRISDWWKQETIHRHNVLMVVIWDTFRFFRAPTESALMSFSSVWEVRLRKQSICRIKLSYPDWLWACSGHALFIWSPALTSHHYHYGSI